ncbi:MAG: hypothetical protein ACQER6_01360 [Pseudomonadota bacterium]
MTDRTPRDTRSLLAPANLLGALALPGSSVDTDHGCVGTLPLEVLDGGAADGLEAFRAPGPVSTRGDSDHCLSRAGGLLFGSIRIDESAGLATGSETAYRRLFEDLARGDTPQLWRVWHYIPAINAHDPATGLERYRLFNQGRAAAFDSAGRDASHSAPAACALGCPADATGRLFFLAADTPARRIENPRQVSAWNYPRRYGPKSPLFARAVLAPGRRHDWLFVSGTASITGHETRHDGDVLAQTDETLTNLQTVLDQANAQRSAEAPPFAWDKTGHLRVYLRHPEHLVRVRQRLDHWLGESARRVYLQADVCREDLLVEIEATLRRPAGGHRSTDTLWPEL